MRNVQSVLARGAAILIGAVCLVSCTTELRKLPESKWQNESATYQPYYLPQLELKVSVSRTLKKCGTRFEPEPLPTEVVAAVEMEASYSADETQPIVVDYEALDRPVSQVSLAFERYDNRTLKSINASIEDKTGQVASNVMSGIVTLVTKSVLPARLMASRSWMCKDGIVEAVAQRDRLAQRVSALEKKLANLVGVPDGSPGDPYTDALKLQIKDVKGELKEAKENLEPIAAQLRITDVQTWVPRSFSDGTIRLAPSQILMDRWFVKLDGESAEAELERQNLEKQLAVVASIEPSVPNNGLKKIAQNKTALVYREPAKARVRACAMDVCPQGPVEAPRLLLSKDVDFPQGGTLVPLKLRNGPFDDTSLAATFAPSGAMVSFKYVSAAELVRMSETFKEGATAAGTIATSVRNSEVDRLKAEAERIKAETELIKARNERDKLLTTPAPN